MKTLRFLLALSLVPALFALYGCNDDDAGPDTGTYQCLDNMEVMLLREITDDYDPKVDSLLSDTAAITVGMLFYDESHSVGALIGMQCTPCFLTGNSFPLWAIATDETGRDQMVLASSVEVGQKSTSVGGVEIPGKGRQECFSFTISLPGTWMDDHFYPTEGEYDFYLQFEDAEQGLRYRSPRYRLSVRPAVNPLYFVMSLIKVE